jgi:hypothetical protein
MRFRIPAVLGGGVLVLALVSPVGCGSPAVPTKDEATAAEEDEEETISDAAAEAAERRARQRAIKRKLKKGIKED